MRTALLALTIILAGCTNSSEAVRALSKAGYKDIQIGGWDMFACGKGDWYATKFEATINGQKTSGVVCSGLLFKSSTIRF
jgi:hypothetical protein